MACWFALWHLSTAAACDAAHPEAMASMVCMSGKLHSQVLTHWKSHKPCVLLMAPHVVLPCRESENNCKFLQLVSGASPAVYWLANFCWDMLNSSIPAGGYCAACVVVRSATVGWPSPCGHDNPPAGIWVCWHHWDLPAALPFQGTARGWSAPRQPLSFAAVCLWCHSCQLN